jgi:hypothetical protein
VGGYRRDVLDLFNGTNKDKRQEAFKGDRAVFCPDDGKLFNDFVVP